LKIFLSFAFSLNLFLLEIPLIRDDGSLIMIKGFRSRHNTWRGPAKGGIRFHPGASMSEALALSIWMTWKGGIANIPLGGGKGAIEFNPKDFSKSEIEAMTGQKCPTQIENFKYVRVGQKPFLRLRPQN
jgi:glutamate dehydrogenase/leucine dehydrogenase